MNDFKIITAQDIANVLSLTIKEDLENKLITFLAMLTAYTESDQLNLSFNAPSSTGKSYIPNEVSKLFPKEDVMNIAHASPTAFFHEAGKKEKDGTIKIDLSRKILIFLDQPHQLLLERLRSLLSHDQKELIFKSTGQKGGNHATKTVKLIGYPVVVFCSAAMSIDEQESTRFILLSPETHRQKIMESISSKVAKLGNPYVLEEIYQNPERQELMKRIRAIKLEKIEKIIIHNTEKLEDYFIKGKATLLPRHQRDVGKVSSLIKAFTLLNWQHRKREGKVLYTDDKDFESAFALWNQINQGQELGLPPYIFKFYKDIILGYLTEDEISQGLSRRTISRIHLKKYGRPIPDHTLRTQILPSLENAGLIEQRKNPKDKRETLIYPTPQTI